MPPTEPDTSPEPDARALVVAIELLRRSVADIPGAIAANAADTLDEILKRKTADGRSVGGRSDGKYDDAPGLKDDKAIAGEKKKAADDARRDRLAAIAERRRKEAEDRLLADDSRGWAGRRAKGVKDEFSSSAAGDMLLTKFREVLGPLAVFGQVLQSNVAGFSILGKAVQVLAATLGPILLPVVAILGGAMLELSDRLWDEIAPALEDFYRVVVDVMIPALEWMIDAFMGVIDVVQAFAGAVRDAVDWVGDALDSINPFSSDDDEDLAAMVEEFRKSGMSDEEIAKLAADSEYSPDAIARAMGTAAAAGAAGEDFSKAAGAGGGADFGWGGDDSKAAGGKPERGADPERIAREAMRTGDVGKAAAGGGGVAGKTLEFLREMRMSFMPTASIGGLGGVGNAAQLAAMNQSPFEARMLERMDKAISTLERVVEAARGDAPPVFGDGRR